MSAVAPPMIRVEHLSKRFKRARILDDVTLRIETGERVALVGANGAGKTTLIRCLLGEYQADGDVALGGMSPRIERGVSVRRLILVLAAGVADGASPAQLSSVVRRTIHQRITCHSWW